jgi:hypothetical protein
MNKDITVYWAIPHGQGYVPYFLNIENPSPLIIELKKLGQYLGDNQENAYSGSILKCPSVIDITKNNFVITSPMDIDITWQNGKISVPKEMSSYVQIRDDNSGFLSLTFIKYIFFTEEENLTMRVRNAFFTNNYYPPSYFTTYVYGGSVGVDFPQSGFYSNQAYVYIPGFNFTYYGFNSFFNQGTTYMNQYYLAVSPGFFDQGTYRTFYNYKNGPYLSYYQYSLSNGTYTNYPFQTCTKEGAYYQCN